MANLRDTIAQERDAQDAKWDQEYGDTRTPAPESPSVVHTTNVSAATDALWAKDHPQPVASPAEGREPAALQVMRGEVPDVPQGAPDYKPSFVFGGTGGMSKGEFEGRVGHKVEGAAAGEGGDTVQAAVPTQPSPDQLEGMKHADGFWNQIVATKFAGKDPTIVNPVEAGIVAKQAFKDAHFSEFLDPAGTNYATFEKAAVEVQKDAENKAAFASENAWKIKNEVFKFAASKEARAAITAEAERKAAQDKKPTIDQAYLATRTALKDISNFDLPTGETIGDTKLKAMAKGEIPRPTGTRMKPEALQRLNTLRQSAGMAPMKEVSTPMDVHNYRDFGFGYVDFLKTKGSKTPILKYDYVEDKAGAQGAKGGGGGDRYVVGKQYPGTGKYAGKTGTYMGNGQWQIQ